jgi:predicted nucleic acid-binding Zn ribbon protein
MKRCEVCGTELKPHRKRFCSLECKSIAQTKEWQVIQEIQRKNKITLVELEALVEYRLNRRYRITDAVAEIIDILRKIEEIKIIIR